MEKLESLIKTYNDFPKKGIAFKDLLGIIQDSEIFRELILRMSLNHVIKNSEAIISIEDLLLVQLLTLSQEVLDPSLLVEMLIS